MHKTKCNLCYLFEQDKKLRSMPLERLETVKQLWTRLVNNSQQNKKS